MTHFLKLQPIFFEKIISGQKIIEIRLFDAKRQLIKVGDIIVFKKEPDLVKICRTKVETLLLYPTFKELLKAYPIKLFGGNNRKELLSTLHQFYTTADEKKYTVVGIKFKILTNKPLTAISWEFCLQLKLYVLVSRMVKSSPLFSLSSSWCLM